MTRDPPAPDEPEHMEGATKALSQYNGKHRTRSDAYLQATRLTALVTVAALTVAAGSAGATSTLSGRKISDLNRRPHPLDRGSPDHPARTTLPELRNLHLPIPGETRAPTPENR